MYNEDFESGYSHERSGDEIYSKPVRAGKRTYFFDVKSTKGNNDFYLTITESKRRIEQDGRYSYDKHKIFLYKEDFEKFAEGLEEAVEYIKTKCLKGEPISDRHFQHEDEGQENDSVKDPDVF
ncbi:MAG: DUF3276 family protein [Bacteroides sp.]|nr:PUR family DNA/RNA-binding protein [Bacteroides sp.]MDD6150011.1 DUF3276 family protein [Bacteroides sp.]MED9900381.1 DUF3276 family protein [Bacteroidales bacterium]